VPEGHDHVALVELLLRAVNEKESPAVFTDRAGELRERRCPNLGGFIPDVYAMSVKDIDRRDVGEAKSTADLASSRTVPQLRAFLDHLAIFARPGLLLAVPFIAVPTAFSIVQRLLSPSHRHINVVVLAPHVRRVVAAGWTI
jgi:hypothetical protein